MKLPRRITIVHCVIGFPCSGPVYRKLHSADPPQCQIGAAATQHDCAELQGPAVGFVPRCHRLATAVTRHPSRLRLVAQVLSGSTNRSATCIFLGVSFCSKAVLLSASMVLRFAAMPYGRGS